ncbi:MAG: DASS family sodium-coupled anion symporter, partial [Bdellovibrionales bacterium]|nr:DASS family sodium-coupled anion symporter [Bdellovibrionales bacterium]
VAYSASLGGIGTLIGSPPNAIAAKYMADSGSELSFFNWLITALPFVVTSLVLCWLILLFKADDLDKRIHIEHTDTAPLNSSQYLVLGIFLLTVILWLSSEVTKISASTVALIPLILFSFLGIIDEDDIHRISWSTLLLFGGGLSLGTAIMQSGADKTIISLGLESWKQMNPFLLILSLSFFAIFVTMIASNTASAAILIPMLLPLTQELPITMSQIVYLIAIGVSLDFMMPMGTPPSAIAYSTGLVSVKEMLKTGFIINLLTGLLLSLYVVWL